MGLETREGRFEGFALEGKGGEWGQGFRGDGYGEGEQGGGAEEGVECVVKVGGGWTEVGC